MRTRIIKEKAKLFMTVNKYAPLIAYAAQFAVFAMLLLLTIQMFFLNVFLLIYGILLLLGFYFLSAGINFSLTDYYLRSYNQNTEETFSLFEGYKKEYFSRVLLLKLIKTGIALVGLVFLIFPGIIFLVRSSFASHIIKANPKLSAWEAIKQSNKLMQGHDFELLTLAVSFAGWYLLSIITLGMLSVYVAPYYFTAKAIFFRNVLLQKTDDDPNYLNDFAAALQKPEKTNINSEIEEIERQIKLIELQKAMKSSQKNLPKPDQQMYNQAIKQPLPGMQYKNPAQGGVHHAGQSAARSGSRSRENLFMEDVGDVRGIITDSIEEVVLPDVKKTNPAFFVTSEVEIMEHESFEDFKKRIERLRREREEQRRLMEEEMLAEKITKAAQTSSLVADAKRAYITGENSVVPPQAQNAAYSTPQQGVVYSKPAPQVTNPSQPRPTPQPMQQQVSQPAQQPALQSMPGATPVAKTAERVANSSKLTREEILERLKHEREKKNAQSAERRTTDK